MDAAFRHITTAHWVEIISIVVISIAATITAFATDQYGFIAVPVIIPIGYFLLTHIRVMYQCTFLVLPLSFTIYLGSVGVEVFSEPLMLFISLIGVLYFFIYWRRIRTNTLLHPITFLMIMTLVWAFVTTLTSTEVVKSIKYLLVQFWMMGSLYFGALYFLRSIADWKRLFWLFFIGLTSYILLVNFRHAAEGFTFESTKFIVYPAFDNHVDYAAVIVFFFPLLLWARKIYHSSSVIKNCLNVAIVIYIASIFLSYTRAAIVVLLTYPAIYLMFRWKLVKLALIATAIGSVVFYTQFVHDTSFVSYAPNYNKAISHKDFGNLVEATYKFEDVSTMERLYRWVASYYMVQDRPIFGFGPHAFYDNYQGYSRAIFQTYVSDNPNKSTVHNNYILILVEQGVIGLLLFLSIIMAVILGVEKLIHHPNVSPQEQYLLISLGMSFIGFLIMCLMNDLLIVDKLGAFFYLPAAAVVIVYAREMKVG